MTTFRAGRHDRAIAVARAAGAGALLTAYPPSVAWLTGYGGETAHGPRPFALPPLALLRDDAPPALVISEDEASGLRPLECSLITYSDLDDARRNVRSATQGARVATEAGYLPATLGDGCQLVDVRADLARARAIKDPDEIDKLRSAIALCDAGQRAAREHAAPGMSELELWSIVRGAVEQAAGQPVPLLGSLLSGERTAMIGGPPTSRVIDSGDLVLLDLVPYSQAYWGDSCATFSVGARPSASGASLGEICQESLERVLEAVAPGTVASDLDALGRRGLDYPHHTGHGLGTLPFEEPRITEDSDVILEPGMVIAFEPGSYDGREGVRVEKVVLVTDEGAEVLSRHDVLLEQ